MEDEKARAKRWSAMATSFMWVAGDGATIRFPRKR
jgi:hypothetical protein